MMRARVRSNGPFAALVAGTLLAGFGCAESASESGSASEAAGGQSPVGSSADTTGAAGGGAGGATPEVAPEAAKGSGVSDPIDGALHDHGCAGVDWQRVDGWLMLAHKAPEVAEAGKIERCVDRYAGWVTNDADAAQVSRGSVYAALAAAGQCEADTDYDGALIPGPLCAAVHTELDETACLQQMKASRAFGIETVAKALVLPGATKAHRRDTPLMAAYLGEGKIACGGADRWKLEAPNGFVDRFVRAYNAYRALSGKLPSCSKRIVLTVALYMGMDDPGDDGVAKPNGCWTYERVSKLNTEWKLCGYDGSVHHPDGVKWIYDDTNTEHDATLDKQRILDCAKGAPGRGYVYMANRGAGWPKRVTTGVRAHFAELYSSQYAVDDQYAEWKAAGEPGEPMINLGEPDTSATHIHDATLRVCQEVKDGGFLGIYVYPTSLAGNRMSGLVKALNKCTD